MAPEKTSFQKGDVIADRYQVERMIGRGGMGMVYLVVDQESGKRLALKTLLPQYVAHKHAMHRFVREVRAVRKLDHPAVVKVHDAQKLGSLMYYTMDYVQGRSLRDWMEQRGHLGIGSTVRILALLADALDHAHQFTIHRDLSPENVMILSDGSVRLLDFGLAKITDQQAAFTMIGTSLGKLQYIAPEQRANAAAVDHRADIYSLGVMFYEMLSGKLPKPGVALSSLVDDLPPGADAFVEMAMAENPEYRYGTAREFRTALMQVYKSSQRKNMTPMMTAPGETPAASSAARPWWARLAAFLGWPSFGKKSGASSGEDAPH